MSLIGKLAVAVVGDINEVKKSFAETKKEARGLAQDISGIGASLKTTSRIMAAAGTAIIGGMVAITMKTIEAANAADKLAKQTGLTREEIQELGYAADQEHASLEKIATAILRLSRNMSDASRGTGEARHAFEKLGIAVTKSDGQLRNSVDVMLDVADCFKNMRNETEMTAAAMQLFGRSGAEIVPFLRMGGDEIRNLMQEARDLGYVMDEETGEALKALGDQLTALKAALAGVAKEIAAEVVPHLLEMSNKAVGVAKAYNKIDPELRSFITQTGLVTAALALLTSGFMGLIIKIAKFKAALAGLGVTIKGLTAAGTGPFAILIATLASLIAIFQKLQREGKALNRDLSKADLKQAQESLKLYEKLYNIQLWERERYQEKLKMDEEARKLGLPVIEPYPFDEEAFRRIEDGLNRAKKRVAELTKKEEEEEEDETTLQFEDVLGKINNEIAKFDAQKYLKDLRDRLAEVDQEEKLFGVSLQTVSTRANILRSALIELTTHKIDPQKTSMGDLIQQYESAQKAVAEYTKAIENQQEKENLLAQLEQSRVTFANRNLSHLAILALKMEEMGLENEAQQAWELAAEWEGVTEAEKNAADAANLLAQAQQKLTEMTSLALPEWEEFAEKLREMAEQNGVLDETREKLLEMANAISEAGAEADAQEIFEERKRQAEELYEEYKFALSDSIRDGFERGKGFADGFVSYLADKIKIAFYDSLADSILKAMNFEPTKAGNIFGGLFNSLSGLFGGGKQDYAQNTAGLMQAIYAGEGAAATAASTVSGGLLSGAMPFLGPLAMIGSLLGGLFGGGPKGISIKASVAKMDIDFATANFKEVTLPSSYMGRGVPSSNAVAPVYNINVSVNAAGSLLAERDLEKRIQSSVVAGIASANAKSNKWQPVTVREG